jgi:hypothetical protein
MNTGQSATVSHTSIPLVHSPAHSVIGIGPPAQQRSLAQSFGDVHLRRAVLEVNVAKTLSGQAPPAPNETQSPRRFDQS